MSGPDVIVIGAGVAGLTVARDVTAAGLRVLLLEARRRLGGRIMTHHTPDGPIELGAEFVHGAVEETLGVAVGAGLSLRETDRSSAREPREGSAPPTDFFSAIDTLLAHAAHASGGDDESFQHLVDRVDVDRTIKARGLGLVEGYHAADPAKISVQSLLDNTAADEGPGAERQFRFVRGYDGLVTALFEQAVRELCTCSSTPSSPASHGGRGTPSFARPRAPRSRSAAGRRDRAARRAQGRRDRLLPAAARQGRCPFAGSEMGAAARVSLQFEHDAWAEAGFVLAGRFPLHGRAALPGVVDRPPRAPARHHRLGRWPPRAGARDARPDPARGGGPRGAGRRGRRGCGPAARRASRRQASATTGRAIPSRAARIPAGVGGRRAGTELAAPVDSTLFSRTARPRSPTGATGGPRHAIASGRRAAKDVLAALRAEAGLLEDSSQGLSPGSAAGADLLEAVPVPGRPHQLTNVATLEAG